MYACVSDPEAETSGMLRIVDESGEDYLFPARFFARIELLEAAKRAFTRVRPNTALQLTNNVFPNQAATRLPASSSVLRTCSGVVCS